MDWGFWNAAGMRLASRVFRNLVRRLTVEQRGKGEFTCQ